MLYQQGLTELIHSSPSEQVAYLLVERASLLETSELTDKVMSDGNTANHMGTGAQVKSTSVSQVRGRTSQIQSHMANMHIVFLVCDAVFKCYSTGCPQGGTTSWAERMEKTLWTQVFTEQTYFHSCMYVVSSLISFKY